jgi:hypothetical protein
MKYRVLIVSVVSIFCVFQLLSTSANNEASKDSLQNSTNNQSTNRYWHKLAGKSKNMFSQLYSPAHTVTTSFNKNDRDNGMLVMRESNAVAKKKSGSSPFILNNKSENTSYSELSVNKPSADNSTYIYISENVGNDILRCTLHSNGVSDCKVVLSNIMGPQDMVVLNDNFYLISYYQATLFSCGLLSNGDIESCSQIVLPSNKNTYMSYNKYSLYITDLFLNKTIQCNLNYDLLIQNCLLVPPLISPNLVGTPSQVFNVANYSGYTYYTVYNSQISQLQVKRCVESACSVVHDPNLSGPNTIKILNNTAYLTDGNTNNLISCVIETNGNLALCRVLKSGLQVPVAIAFYSPKS